MLMMRPLHKTWIMGMLVTAAAGVMLAAPREAKAAYCPMVCVESCVVEPPGSFNCDGCERTQVACNWDYYCDIFEGVAFAWVCEWES